MNVLQILGMQELCRQPLEVPLSMGDERVAQLLGPKRAKPHCRKTSSAASGLVYALCVLYFILGEWPRASWDVCCLVQGLLGKVPRSPASAAGPVC